MRRSGCSWSARRLPEVTGNGGMEGAPEEARDRVLIFRADSRPGFAGHPADQTAPLRLRGVLRAQRSGEIVAAAAFVREDPVLFLHLRRVAGNIILARGLRRQPGEP